MNIILNEKQTISSKIHYLSNAKTLTAREMVKSIC